MEPTSTNAKILVVDDNAEQKERLTAFVIHDLKTPVNAMDLYAQLLLRNR